MSATPASPERHHRYRAPVLEILGSQTEPITAQAIHAELRGRGVRIGLSTVYRELHALTRIRKVHELQLAAQVGYRLGDGSPRDYLVCSDCGRVEELAGRMRIALPLAQPGFPFDTTASRVLHIHCAKSEPTHRACTHRDCQPVVPTGPPTEPPAPAARG